MTRAGRVTSFVAKSQHIRERFFLQAEDGIRDADVTGVQTCALPISGGRRQAPVARRRPSPRPPPSAARRSASARQPIRCAAVPAAVPRYGLTLPFAGVSLADHEPLVRRADELGYRDLWSGEATGYDGFTPLALAAAWTSRVRLGTGVGNPYTRRGALMGAVAAGPGGGGGGRL